MSAREIDARELDARLRSTEPPIVVDVREPDEVATASLAGAVAIPLGLLDAQCARALPDRRRSIVVYCASGVRSARAAHALEASGYSDVTSLAGGITSWREHGLPVRTDSLLSPRDRARYARHVLLPEVGDAGQAKLRAAKVLVLGAGGLGSPAALYLAAAGVGTIGLVDHDVVDESNLQRQILHRAAAVGQPKVESGARTLAELEPETKLVPLRERLTAENAAPLFEGWDVIVDGTDNFPTRYVVNDASVAVGKAVVHGSVLRFEGQVTTFVPDRASSQFGMKATGCYRCLHPKPPPPHVAPSCQEIGVLGVICGVVGTLQATEALKLLLGRGESLAGRLLLYDGLGARFHELALLRDPRCATCGGVEP